VFSEGWEELHRRNEVQEMKVHRFAKIGDVHTVNIDQITHIWSLRNQLDRNKININSLGGVYLGVYEDDGTSEYEDAKKLRDQLVGGWHDHNFAQLGPMLSVNPAMITGFRTSSYRICMIFANDYTIGLDQKDSGYDEALKLHDFLVTGTRDGGAHAD
jgi:hypothetical protein